MRIIEPYFTILTPIDRNEIYRQIELAARTCYKSENMVTPESSAKIVKHLVAHNHLAMLEHASIAVKFVVDRGVSHEIVRHRVASYAQESTRYCNYGINKFNNEITVIRPSEFEETSFEYEIWRSSCEQAEEAYLLLIDRGVSPQWARSVLPHSLKTEIVVNMNLREWLHFFNLRAIGVTGAPHPQIKEVAIPLLEKFAKEMPEVFGGLIEGEV